MATAASTRRMDVSERANGEGVIMDSSGGQSAMREKSSGAAAAVGPWPGGAAARGWAGRLEADHPAGELGALDARPNHVDADGGRLAVRAGAVPAQQRAPGGEIPAFRPDRAALEVVDG